MRSKFYFASSNDSSRSLSSTSSDLPFPTVLPRSDFLTSDFNPSTYLTSLGHRHQTLEDLRLELRARSQSLNQELLDLVNAHYADFLGIGISLKGGEGKIEELRVGVLGFQRELEAIQKDIVEKEEEVQLLLDERARTTRGIVLAKLLLNIGERIQRLERSLLLSPSEENSRGKNIDLTKGVEASDSSEDEDEDEEVVEDIEADTLNITITKLDRHVKDYRFIKQLCTQAGKTHPLVRAYETRLNNIHQALLSDFQSLLNQVKKDNLCSSTMVMNIAVLRRDLRIHAPLI